MISQCQKTQNSRARKNAKHEVISHGSAIRHFKNIATEWWWLRDSNGKLGFFARTRAFPEGILVTAAVGFGTWGTEIKRIA